MEIEIGKHVEIPSRFFEHHPKCETCLVRPMCISAFIESVTGEYMIITVIKNTDSSTEFCGSANGTIMRSYAITKKDFEGLYINENSRKVS